MAAEKETRTVELPDMEKVHDWFEANKGNVICRLETELIRHSHDIKISVRHDGDSVQYVLLLKFCMALRKGEV